MNREEVQLTYVSLDLSFLPSLRRFTGAQLPDLYAALHNRHPFESFEMHGDSGATMSTDGVNELEVNREGLQFEEQVRIDFELLRRNFADVVDIVQSRFSVRGFIEPFVVMRALWPLPAGSPEPDAGELLRQRSFKLNADQYNMLKLAQPPSASMVMSGDLEASHHIRLELSPYSSDHGQLYIELMSHQHNIIETPKVIEEHLKRVYDYLYGDVIHFISTIVS
jgi:hypothetical protein